MFSIIKQNKLAHAHLILLLIMGTLTHGCVTSPKKRSAQKKKNALKSTSSLTMEQISDPSSKIGEVQLSSTASENAADLTSNTKKTPVAKIDENIAAPPSQGAAECRNFIKMYLPSYQALYNGLTPQEQKIALSKNPSLLNIDATACDQKSTLMPTLKTLSQISGNHTGRIGLILPLSGPSSHMTPHIIKGMRSAFLDMGQNASSFENTVRIRDSGGQPQRAGHIFADLVLNEQCSFVIGGYDRNEATELMNMTKSIRYPLIILSGKSKLPPDASTVFVVFPNEKRLSEHLATESIERGYKKIAIIKPNSDRSEQIVSYFKDAMSKKGAKIVAEATYVSGQYDSMQSAMRQLLRTNIVGREGEYQEMIRNARREAEKRHEHFDPRLVVLKPIVEFDALFIPDDFRTVRHLIKLIKFHMVDKMPLIGYHEWRSPSLIDPPEPFLEGSIFADFIGSYQSLPKGIAVSTLGSPYFVAPKDVSAVDFELIGYRLGRVAYQALAQKPQSRMFFTQILSQLKSEGVDLFGKGLVFGQDHTANWPTYLFKVKNDQINLMDVQSSNTKAVSFNSSI